MKKIFNPRCQVVCLQEAEIRLAKFLGVKRHEYNESVGYKYTQYKPEFKTPEEFWAWTYRGELAACRNFNVYPDLGIGNYQPYDMVVNGFTVDVKTCLPGESWFSVTASKAEDPADFYMVMQGDYNLEYMGWIFNLAVFQEENKVRPTGRKNYYKIKLDQLTR